MERIKMMFEDAQPKALITRQTLKSTFGFFSKKTYLIDEMQDEYYNVELKPSNPNDLAYIMYTSGSTGKPKGILIEHEALKHAALAYKQLHPEKPVSLVCGSISFDTSLLLIVHSLILGGTICLYDNKNGVDVKNPREVVDIINNYKISFILTMPFFYSKLLSEGVQLLSLRNVDLCGEKISNQLVKNHTKIAPNAFLYNAYGPTEYAMGVTAAVIYNPKTQKSSEISIGKVFSCNKLYILDSNFNEVRANEKGELFIGGPGLARGYLNHKKLNKERFLWLSSLEETPVRLYRTGDLGYYLPNGDIVFVGRDDFQLKIKGHRVELDEVEHVINECPGVKKGIVINNTHPNEGEQLITFYSLLSGFTDKELKDYLCVKLPEYMLPSKYIQMEDWPILENGKIDRKSLRTLINS
ncbi:MAG TPA: AMP-binding protein [Candidatus Babeliales bacterium]|nr:AMP-binding protein [Candidatus Babeliales bacterium]